MWARAGNAQTAILTSKGETLLGVDWVYLSNILLECSLVGFGQRDLHSNMSLVLDRQDEFLEWLIKPRYGLTNVTITVASLDFELNYELMGIHLDYTQLFKFLKEKADVTVRLSCVMNKQGVYNETTIINYIKRAISLGVDSIVFRELWIPENSKENSVTQWSRDNFVDIQVARDALEWLVLHKKARSIIWLPWGEVVYDVFNSGLQVTVATCVVNEYKDGFKSVIHLPDGHLYTSWSSKASRIM